MDVDGIQSGLKDARRDSGPKIRWNPSWDVRVHDGTVDDNGRYT